MPFYDFMAVSVCQVPLLYASKGIVLNADLADHLARNKWTKSGRSLSNIVGKK